MKELFLKITGFKGSILISIKYLQCHYRLIPCTELQKPEPPLKKKTTVTTTKTKIGRMLTEEETRSKSKATYRAA